jgi:hypothetical protein
MPVCFASIAPAYNERVRHVVLVMLAACGFSARSAEVVHDSSLGGEGAPVIIDGPPDVAQGSSCTTHAVPPSLNVDPTQWNAKFLTAPMWNCNAVGTTTIDTSTGSITSTSCALGGIDTTMTSSLFVVRLRDLRVTNSHKLVIVGNKPVVLLVAGNVVVDTGALIDVSAEGAVPGPGGSPATCVDNASGLGTAGTTPNWGGGGGGYGTAGGQGAYQVTNGGLATGTATLVPLRGGCSGGIGDGKAGTSPQPGGGGGAIEIDASGTISVGATSAANIAASGGGAPANDGGGNGGGAGGAILLVSPATAQLGVAGALRANGGAGSEGCSSACNGPASGTSGHKTDSAQALDTSGIAGGGNNLDHGRRGGLADLVGAAALVSAPGDMTTAQSGGRGGGGGGGGRLRIATSPATTSCD